VRALSTRLLGEGKSAARPASVRLDAARVSHDYVAYDLEYPLGGGPQLVSGSRHGT